MPLTSILDLTSSACLFENTTWFLSLHLTQWLSSTNTLHQPLPSMHMVTLLWGLNKEFRFFYILHNTSQGYVAAYLIVAIVVFAVLISLRIMAEVLPSWKETAKRSGSVTKRRNRKACVYNSALHSQARQGDTLFMFMFMESRWSVKFLRERFQNSYVRLPLYIRLLFSEPSDRTGCGVGGGSESSYMKGIYLWASLNVHRWIQK